MTRLVPLALVLFFLPGCGPKPGWEGMTPAQVTEAVRDQNLGIAHLEEQARDKASVAFQALTQVAPNVALGYANLAATLMTQPEKSDQALGYARKAVDLAPNDAAVRLVLAQLLQQQRDYDGALQQLTAAAKAEPTNARVLFQLSEVYQLRAGGNRLTPERGQVLKQLVDSYPDNLAAQLYWADFTTGAGRAAEALAALDRAVALAGPLPRGGSELLAAARSALQAGDTTRAAGSVQVLSNILRPTPRQIADRNVLEGAKGDPATFAVRHFTPPPPPLPETPTTPISVRFVDVTATMGMPAGAQIALASAQAGTLPAGSHALTRAALAVAPLAEDQTPRPYVMTEGSAPTYPVKNPLPALYVASPNGLGRLYQIEGGRLVDTTAAAGLAGVSGTVAQFVDVDNDGKLDLYVAGRDPDRVFRGLSGGRFTPMPVRGLPAAQTVVNALWGDFDHDGDLDLLRLEPGSGGGVRLFLNNADGSFTESTKAAGLTATAPSPRMALFADFDDDGDLDFFVVDHGGANQLYDDQRGGRFAEVGAARGLKGGQGSLAAAVADVNHDGLPDLVVVGEDPPSATLYLNHGGSFAAEETLQPLLNGFAPVDVAFLDYDNDGERDLIFAGRSTAASGGASGGGTSGLRLLRGLPGGKFTDATSILPAVPAARAVVPADLDGDGATDLILLREDGRLMLLHNEGGAKNRWLNVTLEGEIKGSQKNNAFGLGATLEVKRGRQYQKQTVREPLTHFGLGPDAPDVDVVRAVWSNGVPQNWTDLPAPHEPSAATGTAGAAAKLVPIASDLRVHAKQVLKGSCPFIYAWDGERYRFVTDFLWRGPLGLRLSPTFVAPHDQSTDFVKIPGDRLRAVNGTYFLSLTEELWETVYLDYARLVAVDHPATAGVWVDEVFRFGPPAPFRLYPVAQKRLPAAAVDDAGQDQLPALRANDGRRVAGFELTGYQGVARPHDLTLTLGPVPDPAHVRLFLQGWIFPTDTSINMAVAQNRAIRVIPPRLSVPDGRGGGRSAASWRKVADVGLPAGKNKTVVVDLSGKLAPGDPRVRITTTMEIYWDHIFYTSGPQEVPVHTHTLVPAWTDLQYRGFSAVVQPDRSQPQWFDYDRVDRRPRWRDMEGDFTRFGDVTPLLRAIDDRYVIMNSGDALTVQFDGRNLPPLPTGWARDFVLLTDGWEKDADINTLTSQRVEPLPFHGMTEYPPTGSERYPDTPEHRRYRRDYNTRRVTSRPFLDALKPAAPGAR